MSSTNKIILVTIIIIAVLIIAYWMINNYSAPMYNQPYASPTPTPTPTPSASIAPTGKPTATPTPSPTHTPTTTPTINPVETYNVSVIEFQYIPNALTASVGQKVKITLNNNGALPHNITFPDLNIATRTISPGQTDTIEFTAPPAGNYNFYCSVDSHQSLGLTGTLTIQ